MAGQDDTEEGSFTESSHTGQEAEGERRSWGERHSTPLKVTPGDNQVPNSIFSHTFIRRVS